MKIVVISDTHGHIDECKQIMKKLDNIDMIIHLGDYSHDVANLKKIFNVNIINVRGNCDPLDRKTKDEMIITLEGKKFFLTHGHTYGVKRNLNVIFYRAKELKADIVLFGHSHVPTSSNFEDVLLFNPGSTSMPRGGSKKSYGIIEIKDDKIMSTIHKIEGLKDIQKITSFKTLTI